MTDRALDVAIVTRSARRLHDFYCDVLGLEAAGEVRVSGVVPDGVLMRLRAGGSTLKILQFDHDPAGSAPVGDVSQASGLRYLTVGVEDIEATLDRCKTASAEVTVPMTALSISVAIAFVRDPDGNVVELVGTPPPTHN